MISKNKKRVTVSLDKELIDLMRIDCISNNITFSDYISQLIYVDLTSVSVSD